MKINLGRSVRVLISLFLLLALTTALAFVPLGPWNWLASVLFAFTMAGLILLFFMKVRYSEPLLWLTSAAGFTWLSLLILLVLLDYISRPWPG
jgi:cytochrome c oxidase subunit IV